MGNLILEINKQTLHIEGVPFKDLKLMCEISKIINVYYPYVKENNGVIALKIKELLLNKKEERE